MTARTWYPWSEYPPKKWFRRGDYHGRYGQKGDARPLWHVLDEGRTRTKNGLVTAEDLTGARHLVALCGYSRDFMLESAMIQDQVKNDKIKCVKCMKKEAERELARVQSESADQ